MHTLGRNRWKGIAAGLLVLAMLLAAAAVPAQAQNVVVLRPITFTGSVVAVAPTEVTFVTGGNTVIIPSAIGPAFLVNGTTIAFSSLTPGMVAFVTVPQVSGYVVAVQSNELTFVEPSGVSMLLPVSVLPSPFMTQTVVQVITPSGLLQSLALASAISMLTNGNAYLVVDQAVAYAPAYTFMDFGPMTMVGTVQTITPTYIIVMTSGGPATLPIVGSTFLVNNAPVQVSSLAVGRPCTVRVPSLSGTLVTTSNNTVVLQTRNNVQVKLPASAIPAKVAARQPVFMRLKNGHVVSQPLQAALSAPSPKAAPILQGATILTKSSPRPPIRSDVKQSPSPSGSPAKNAASPAPAKPAMKASPATPATKATPAKPITPATPSKPVAKPTPATPSKPVAKPTTPATPAKPTTPSKPVAKPTTPARPIPAKPTPGASVKPSAHPSMPAAPPSHPTARPTTVPAHPASPGPGGAVMKPPPANPHPAPPAAAPSHTGAPPPTPAAPPAPANPKPKPTTSGGGGDNH